jgi:CubicO group peptidase (beta-lactamase class C family)
MRWLRAFGMYMNIAVLAGLLASAGCASTGREDRARPQDDGPELRASKVEAGDIDAFIQDQMGPAKFPSLAACIVKDGEVAWAKAYGTANFETTAAATPFTFYLTSSLSKPVTAAVVLKAQEQGLIDLDADVSNYFPYPLRNPHHPQMPITARMLLTHTSSIRDEEVIYHYLYTVETTGGDSDIGLDVFLENYLRPEGEWFAKDQSFYPFAPGAESRFSNIGYALAGLLVEQVSGMPFHAYARQHLLEPLGMGESAWFLRDLQPEIIAMPYQFRANLGQLPYGHYGFPTYPDGQLRTSVMQYGNFLAMILSDGVFRGKQVLSPESVAQMKRVQLPGIADDVALGWWFGTVGGLPALGVDGSDKGVYNTAFIMVDGSTAIAVFTNGERTAIGEKAMFAIQERLLMMAQKSK